MQRTIIGGVLATMLAASNVAAQQLLPTPEARPQSSSLLDVVIGERMSEFLPGGLVLTLPVSTCVVPMTTEFIVKKAVRMPAGIEALPEPCRTAPSATPVALRARIEFNGLTGRQALDRLISLDPRYYWLESNGVIVVRPISAGNDPKHFLHESIVASHQDVANYTEALQIMESVLRPTPPRHAFDYPVLVPADRQPFAFDIKASLYESLNNLVRSHGALLWRVTHCSREMRRETASIALDTFEETGLATAAVVPPDQKDLANTYCSPMDMKASPATRGHR
jgi:hypothetical protein